MKKFVQIHDEKYPFVVAEYQSLTPTTEEFLQSQSDIEAYVKSHHNFVMIVDLTNMQFLSSELRIQQGKWSKRMEGAFRDHDLAIAFVTPSVIAKLMLKGVLILNAPPVPYAVVSSIEEAMAWGKKQKGL